MYFETPYILDMPPLDQPFKPLSTKYANYQDYDIFALRINLFPILKEIRSDLMYDLEQHEMTFMTENQGSYRDDDLKTRWFVKIYSDLDSAMDVDTTTSMEGNSVEGNTNSLVVRGGKIVGEEDMCGRNSLVVKGGSVGNKGEESGIVKEYTTGNKMNLSEEEIEKIQNGIEEICNDIKNDVVFVLSYEANLVNGSGKPMNQAWINAMIPYAPYDFIQPIYHKTRGLYIILDRDANYEFVYNRFQEQLSSWLQKQWEYGTIPWVLSEKFAKDWNLKLKRRFWRPMTKNHFIMGDDIIDFYLYRIKQIQEKYVWMSQPFYNAFEQKVFFDVLFDSGLKFIQEQNYFLVETTGYEELKGIVAKYMLRLDSSSS